MSIRQPRVHRHETRLRRKSDSHERGCQTRESYVYGYMVANDRIPVQGIRRIETGFDRYTGEDDDPQKREGDSNAAEYQILPRSLEGSRLAAITHEKGGCERGGRHAEP